MKGSQNVRQIGSGSLGSLSNPESSGQMILTAAQKEARLKEEN